MSSNLPYLYSFNYDHHHSDLCKLESRHLFNQEEKEKVLFSDVLVDPSISPFIKNRFEIISSADSYSALLITVKKKKIRVEGFNAEYIILHSDLADFAERQSMIKDVGYSIEGEPNFDSPTITYAICQYETHWYFGILIKPNTDWRNHKTKPYSFSNSLCVHIAKSLVSIASQGNKTTLLLDGCCGVGTVMLEGRFSDFQIEGCDINEKACNHTKENLKHYAYTAKVLCSDINDLDKVYGAVIIDLPYNLYSYSTDAITLKIIKAAARLTSRVVIVSISDIESIIKESGLKTIDSGTVKKRGKSNFARRIWVCERI